jgi:hypothetical protein
MAPFSLSRFIFSFPPLQTKQSCKHVEIPFSIVEGIGFH